MSVRAAATCVRAQQPPAASVLEYRRVYAGESIEQDFEANYFTRVGSELVEPNGTRMAGLGRAEEFSVILQNVWIAQVVRRPVNDRTHVRDLAAGPELHARDDTSTAFRLQQFAQKHATVTYPARRRDQRESHRRATAEAAAHDRSTASQCPSSPGAVPIVHRWFMKAPYQKRRNVELMPSRDPRLVSGQMPSRATLREARAQCVARRSETSPRGEMTDWFLARARAIVARNASASADASPIGKIFAGESFRTSSNPGVALAITGVPLH